MKVLFGLFLGVFLLFNVASARASDWNYPHCKNRQWQPLGETEIARRKYEPVMTEIEAAARSVLAPAKFNLVVAIVDCPNEVGGEVFIEGVSTAARAIPTPKFPEYIHTVPDIVVMVSYRYIEDMPRWSVLDKVILHACSWVALEGEMRRIIEDKAGWSTDRYQVDTVQCLIKTAEKRHQTEEANWFRRFIRPKTPS